MALNQQRQYCSAYNTSNDFSTAKNKKSMEEVIKKTDVSLIESKRSISLSDNKLYALKKRLLLPSWLLEGVLLVLGSKEPWFDSIASTRVGKVIASPNDLNVKCLIPFCFIWHELVSKIFNASPEENVIRLQINKFISGTSKCIQEISKDIEHIFSSPLKLFEIKPSKKTKSYTMSKIGSLNFIRHAHLENDVDGIWLNLNLTANFKEVCYPSELKNNFSIASKSVVSISPVVIQSMGTRASLKKVLNYLFLEFSKQESFYNNSSWNSFHVESKKILPYHKELLSTAPSFYDHGVLGWNNCAPNKKISEIKEMNKCQKNDIICSWQLSDQVKDAFEIEQTINEKIIHQLGISLEVQKPYVQISEQTFNQNKKNLLKDMDESVRPELTTYRSQTAVAQNVSSSSSLFPEPPEDQLRKAREEKKLKRIMQEKEQLAKIRSEEKKYSVREDISRKKIARKIVTQTLFDDGLVTKKVSSEPLVQKGFSSNRMGEKKSKISADEKTLDKDFLILVSEFYESLKPMQKKAFERDRKGMTSEQFRAYMASILQRKKMAQL